MIYTLQCGMKLHRRTRIWVKPLGNEGENRETCTLKIPETINKVPPPVADSAFFCKCNVSFAKCFENFGNHLLQGMAMIVSPLPLVDIVPDLNIQKFVLRNLCMDGVWNEIFRVIPTLVQSLNNHKNM